MTVLPTEQCSNVVDGDFRQRRLGSDARAVSARALHGNQRVSRHELSTTAASELDSGTSATDTICTHFRGFLQAG